MTAIASSLEQPAPKIILVVALLTAVFAAAIIDVVIPINIVDIAETFHILPGTVTQLNSLIAITSFVTALLMASFSSRFRYKSLMMIGVLLIAVCAVGLFLAPTFTLVQLVVPLNGIGSVIIVVTAQTYIGNSYSLDKKAKAIGWVAASGTLANAVGSPIIGFMTDIGGWRSSFIWLMLPASIVSLIFVFLVIPHNPHEPQLNKKKDPLMRSFKQVLTNKSAVACLVATFLGSAFWLGGSVLEVTFLRQIFATSLSFTALIGPLAGTAFITVGTIAGGHVVNRVGRKRLTVVATFLSGILVLLSYFMQDLSIFLAFHWTASILIGITIAAASNLMLEQVPKFRGTTMSLNSAFGGVGIAFGVTLAGAVLNLHVDPAMGFQSLGLTVGALAFAGALVNMFFVGDPIKPSS